MKINKKTYYGLIVVALFYLTLFTVIYLYATTENYCFTERSPDGKYYAEIYSIRYENYIMHAPGDSISGKIYIRDAQGKLLRKASLDMISDGRKIIWDKNTVRVDGLLVALPSGGNSEATGLQEMER